MKDLDVWKDKLNKAILQAAKELEDITTFKVTEKQQLFIDSQEDEVLYGGAAGGGKSYAQLIDAWIKAIRYPNIKQLILRRTFPELKRSLVITSLMLYDQKYAKYNESDKRWKFNNGSIIEFGYCDTESDVTQYQSAEYDIIRIDELTHFTEFQYTYLISRIRGVNLFPKQIKCSTNPGSIGHEWVKRKFIDNKIPQEKFVDENDRSILFIPAKVQENTFLMQSDPNYISRLKQLPENQRKALLDGDWDIYEGQFFTEFRRNIHSIEPFEIPKEWTRYITMDYGLDMFACYFIAMSPENRAYVYKEIYKKDLIISEAAKLLKNTMQPIDDPKLIYAPPDLWNRRQDTGKSAADIFRENGINLIKSKNDRTMGWFNVKEWIKPYDSKDEQTGESKTTSNLLIFKNCINLIRCIPLLQRDTKDPNDCATEPHEITHSVDAIRYFCAMRQSKEKTSSNNFKKIDTWARKEADDSNYKSYFGNEPSSSYINY